MNRQDVEEAILALETLLSKDSTKEELFQKWFENNPVVFVALGYQRVISHPVFRVSEEKACIPDFLVQRPNGSWEIFELKLPNAKLLRDAARRYKFYASFEENLSQCHEYAECLDVPDIRGKVERQYDIDFLNSRPASVLVAGRKEGADLRKMMTLASRRTPPISIYTYDDIKAALLSYRTFNFGKYDSANGITIHATLMLHKPEDHLQKNHILDIGVTKNRDRIAILVDPQGYLRLRVWDSNGTQHDARSSRPIENSDYDVPHWFLFQVGIGSDFGFLSIQIDWKYHADLSLQDFPLNISHEYVLGSDWNAKAPSWFSMYDLIVTGKSITFYEKVLLQKYSAFKPPSGMKLEFKGHKWMSTAGHPANNASDSEANIEAQQ